MDFAGSFNEPGHREGETDIVYERTIRILFTDIRIERSRSEIVRKKRSILQGTENLRKMEESPV